MAGKSAGLSAVAEEPKEEGVTRLFIVGETADYALCQSALPLALSGAPSHPWPKSRLIKSPRGLRSWDEMAEQIRRQRKDNG